jgi:hypothetical protein
MQTERDFWRLLTDYERLTQNESAALSGADFDELAAIHERKAAVFPVLCELAQKAGLDRGNAELARRIDAVTANQSRNADLIAEMIESADEERQGFGSSRNRLRGLGNAYGPDSTQHAGFAVRV